MKDLSLISWHVHAPDTLFRLFEKSAHVGLRALLWLLLISARRSFGSFGSLMVSTLDALIRDWANNALFQHTLFNRSVLRLLVRSRDACALHSGVNIRTCLSHIYLTFLKLMHLSLFNLWNLIFLTFLHRALHLLLDLCLVNSRVLRRVNLLLRDLSGYFGFRDDSLFYYLFKGVVAQDVWFFCSRLTWARFSILGLWNWTVYWLSRVLRLLELFLN